MSEILLWFVVLAGALAVLIKGADVFVEQAATLARALGVSDAIIGVTLVALGTSLPELAASLASALDGAGEFVAGTVVGSNVANIGLIMGAAALAFRGFSVGPQLMRLDMPVLIVSALVLALMLQDGRVEASEGVVLLLLYAVYLSQSLRRQADDDAPRQRPSLKTWAYLLAGVAAIYFGARYTVEAVNKLTTLLGLADVSLLALTVVAVGSSLPELVVSLTAAKKNYHDLSVGNVVGSNICNSFLVMGAPALIQPLPVSRAVADVGLPFMLAISLVFLVMAHSGRVSRHFGLILLLMFGLFIGRTMGAL
ncbi:calcium/sodium antiporter [Desulfarculus baarsii]